MLVEALGSINSGQADKGDILDLSEDEAKALIANGAAREVSREGKATAKLDNPRKEDSSKEEEAAKRTATILEVMKIIHADGKDLTQTGKPEVKAIEDIVEFEVSAKERDDLMDDLEKEEEE